MTPQEKAEELLNKFLKTDKIDNYSFVGILVAKQCALIAVDEMLSNAGFIWGGRDTETGKTARDTYRNYWNEVKQEIETL